MVETDVLQKLFRAFPNSVINHSLEFVNKYQDEIAENEYHS